MYNRKTIHGFLPAAGLLLVMAATFFSCNSSGSGGTGARSDSAASADTSAPKLAFVSNRLAIKAVLPRPNTAFEKIDPDLEHLRTIWGGMYPVVTDAEGDTVQGFYFKSSDYKDLVRLKAASLFFEFGITNLKDSDGIRAHTIKPDYTIMVVPLDAMDKRITDSGKLVAYDYVCPCSKGVGCCPAQ